MVRDEFRTDNNLRIWQLNDNFRKVWELDPISGAVYEYREETFKRYRGRWVWVSSLADTWTNTDIAGRTFSQRETCPELPTEFS